MSHEPERKSFQDAKMGATSEVENAAFTEKTTAADMKADAIEAENAEHNMTVLQAVKAYPMASFWAFVMSFTIVSASILLGSGICG